MRVIVARLPRARSQHSIVVSKLSALVCMMNVSREVDEEVEAHARKKIEEEAFAVDPTPADSGSRTATRERPTIDAGRHDTHVKATTSLHPPSLTSSSHNNRRQDGSHPQSGDVSRQSQNPLEVPHHNILRRPIRNRKLPLVPPISGPQTNHRP